MNKVYGDRKICHELNNNYNFLTPSQVIERDLQAKRENL
jgi:hypothetical protein